MDSDELRKLRQFYHSLLGQQRVLADLSGNVVRGQSILPLEHNLKQLNEEFPSLMPPFIKDDYFSHLTANGQSIYNLTAIQSHIAMALGRLQIAIEPPSSNPIKETESANKKTVFVIHGRDENLRKAMFDFLRSIGLDPLEWSQAIAATKKPSPYIGDILDTAFSLAQAVVVLSSGDDEARLLQKFINDTDPDYEKELTPQPRPNVLFEAGMAMGRSQERTVLVQIGKVRPWSDIAGRHITRLDNSPEKRSEFVSKLQAAGCDANTSGQDWYTTGDFGSSPDINGTN